MIGKRLLSALCTSVLAAGTVQCMAMQTFPDGARVAFFGDSITANGGAMLRIAAHYREAFPGRNLRFCNCGISGGGLESAEVYFDDILAARKPTHVVVAFGVNDSGAMRIDETADDASAEAKRVEEAAAAFRKRYAALVGRIRSLGAEIVLRTTTPYNEFGDSAVAPVNGRNVAYRRVTDEIRAVARDMGLPLIDDYARMSELLSGGEDIFAPDRVHPNDYGQWRMAETLLAAQGLKIAPYSPRVELAAKAGLSAWDDLWQRIADVNSCEWICVRDETLSLEAKLAKVKAWLEENSAKPDANKYVVRIAKGYLRDKPRKAALIAEAESAWAPADGGMPVSKNIRGHENIGWEGGRSFHLTDGLKDLPRVFIVGDSISGQYRDFVKDALEGRVNVSWWSSSLCVTSPSYLRFIEIYLDATKYDVIHINNGLHSLDTPTGDYARELEAAFLLIRKKQPQAKIIWATSTPLKGGRTKKVKELNAAAADVVARVGGIATDDLFALLDPLDRDANWGDEFHHTVETRKMTAKKVTEAILAEIGIDREDTK